MNASSPKFSRVLSPEELHLGSPSPNVLRWMCDFCCFARDGAYKVFCSCALAPEGELKICSKECPDFVRDQLRRLE